MLDWHPDSINQDPTPHWPDWTSGRLQIRLIAKYIITFIIINYHPNIFSSIICYKFMYTGYNILRYIICFYVIHALCIKYVIHSWYLSGPDPFLFFLSEPDPLEMWIHSRTRLSIGSKKKGAFVRYFCSGSRGKRLTRGPLTFQKGVGSPRITILTCGNNQTLLFSIYQ